ncbi:protein-disulfide reductase DsbD [Beijerinckia sp. L45]|uniref:protein-disulfide reductase DsbD family protein n=1 Tax=Beijerinckia sp. L45 TaxID=1641855 RepID=UPI00131C8DDC|nr:protein-disulfide reductase DsbD domain-containing protein [Beijerinckia sp. L45]
MTDARPDAPPLRTTPQASPWTRSRLFALLGIAAASALLTAPADAATSPWVSGDFVQARLIAAVAGTGDLKTLPLGIEVKLDETWKTYWRSPGDAGLPPALAWDGSANLATATLLYPKPQRMTLLGIQTFGYKHDVIFPVDATVATPGQPLELKLKLDILVCAELCVPRTFALTLGVPAGPASADPEAQLIAKARAAVPGGAEVAGLSIASVAEVSDKGALALEIKANAQDPFVRPDIIAEVDPSLGLGLPRLSLSDDRHAATFVIPMTEHLPIGAKLTGRPVTLTLTDGERALEQHSQITQGTSVAEEVPGPSLLAMLGIALLGGLILNLMPCVLPVLSIKFIGVVSQGGRAPAAVRAGFLATAAGIIVSFLAIAGVLIGLKAAGQTIGWGIQFQEPAFIAGMAVLVTLFACHLWGLFEVPLPRVVAAVASRRLGPDDKLIGHFATGAFATLLATPCSAPFLGTAVGFALAGEPITMLAIFLALGIGLALPYLLVAALPRLATRLPKPGRWMLIVKKLMAAPLVATAVWLLAVLASQVSVTLAAGVAGLLVAIAALLVWRNRTPVTRRRFAAPVVAALALTAILVPDLVATQNHARHDDQAIAWQKFDRNAIKSLVSQGKTVFVDVTADWCLTCQANKRLVLSNTGMAARLNKAAVPMQADWTRPNAAIAAYLAAYGRYGIPFNIVYGPGAPAGVVLPELLSSDDVTAALDRAAGDTTPRRADVDTQHPTQVN